MGFRHVPVAAGLLLVPLAAQAPPAAPPAACTELRQRAERAPLDAAAAELWIDYAYCCWDHAEPNGRAAAALAAVAAAMAHCADAPPVARANLRHLRGQLLREAGRPAEALADLTAAAAVLHAANAAAGEATCRTNLAAAWRDLGEWRLAQSEFAQAVALARAADSPDLAAVLESQAQLLWALGEHGAALAALDQATALPTAPADALAMEILRADVLAARGERAADAADLRQAESILRSALDRGDREQLWRSTGQRSLVQQHLVVCLYRRGALAEALQLANEFAGELEQRDPTALDPTIVFSQASLLASAGEFDAARRWMARAVTAAALALRAACATGSEHAVAIRHHELRNLLSSVLSCPSGAETTPLRTAEDLAAWLCGRGLSEWQHRRARRLAELARGDANTAARLAELRAGLQAPPPADAAAAAFARLQRDTPQRELSALAAVEPARLPPDLDEIAGLLPADAVLCVTAHYLHAQLAQEGVATPAPTPRVALFTLSPRGAVQRFDLGTAAEIADAVARERQAVQGNTPIRPRGRDPEGGASATAPTVLGRLLAPVLASLGNEVGRLIVCPDGACAAAPWSAIALPAGGRLGDRFTVTYVDHPWTLRDAAATAAAGSLVALGDVDFGAVVAGDPRRRHAPLSGSAAELGAVATAFATVFPDRSATVLRGAAATWEQLTAHVVGQRYVHLSTHGFVTATGDEATRDPHMPLALVVENDPLSAAGIALAGANLDPARGTATARQLAGLDLTACELAVFACCDSNVGVRAFGDALAGTTAAARAAGARSVIGTLWPIPDDAAATFVGWFYDALWRQQLAPDAALAATERRAKAAGLPPAAWAAFVHYGPVSAR